MMEELAETGKAETTTKDEGKSDGTTAQSSSNNDSENPSESAAKSANEPNVEQKRFYYTFIVFPPGLYWMGSVADEVDRGADEVRHQVRITRPFAILDREITGAELDFPSPAYSELMRQFGDQESEAGFSVDWFDSVSFCRLLGLSFGVSEAMQAYASPTDVDWNEWPLNIERPGFRLPTETELEVAARSGVRSSYGFDSDPRLLEHFAWYMDNNKRRRDSHPPKQLRPNIRGIFDMHGNVFEWTHDIYSELGGELETDPVRSASGLRVLRGGGGISVEAYCRASVRPSDDPTLRSDSVGLRIALTPAGIHEALQSQQAGEINTTVLGTDGALLPRL